VIRLSKRFAISASILLLLAFFSLTISSRGERHYEDCRDPEVFLDPEFLDTLAPLVEVAEHQTAATPTWLVGKIPVGLAGVPNLKVLVARSFDAMTLYLQPDNLLPKGASPDAGRFEWVKSESGEEIPLHFVYARTGGHATRRGAFAIYLFIYANELVRHPLPAQIRTALPDLTRGTRPVTMLVARGAVAGINLEKAEQAAKAWLAQSWVKYREACAPK
jgi:hypothetical protein